MKVLVTGVAGQLGYDVVKELDKRNIENLGVDIADFDLTDENAVKAAVKHYSPTHIVHCAAYTAVDKAESDKETCRRVNVDGTRFLAWSAREIDAKFMHFSTDYVFDGYSKATPWEVDDPKNPQSVYGLTKSLSEDAVIDILDKYYILRLSWVFGKNGHNFIKTMLNLAKQGKSLKVVADQIGAPTYTKDVAVLACDMLPTQKYGIYHTPNQGATSWFDFASEIFELAGYTPDLRACNTADYPSAAKRPLNSKLSLKALDEAGFNRLPHYKNALERYLMELDVVR